MIRRLDRWALAAAALGIVLALPILTYPMGRDQGMYANIAQSIRAGGLPYIDMWDIKPPAIYYLYATGFSVFGASPLTVRLLDLIAIPLALPALFGLTDSAAGRRAARWAMLLFPVFYFTETFASLSQSDSLVLLPMMWAAWAAHRASKAPPATRRALGFALLSGALCAAVMWFKHYYALFAAALAVAHLAARIAVRVSPGRIVREAAAFAVGGLAVGLPVLLYFVATGIFDEMLIVASGTSQYNAQAFSSLSAFWDQMGNYVAFRWWHWGPLLVLASTLPLTLLLPRRQPARMTTLIGLWLVSGIVFVVIQAKGFDTHWLPILPPLTILAALALDRWLSAAQRIDRRLAYAIGGAGGALFAGILAKDTWVRAWPYISGEQGVRGYWRQFQAGDLNAWDSLQMARWLEERTTPSDTVYIFGFRPEVAFLAQLRPATRFQAQFPLVGDRYPQAWKQENVDTLWAALPPYVIVLRADYMPWVTGSDDDSNVILATQYPALSDWLAYNYERDIELGNFLVWKRRGDS
ncbi:MAG: glycosyltransferase family 39 protein [Chloroflexi bacterium]|nr:glycosyltransferase family 39 protein [Chloroflexota bacterium]